MRPSLSLRQVLPAFARSFAAGTYLDKSEVTDRVVSVVKNFSKVDPAKARACRTHERAPRNPGPVVPPLRRACTRVHPPADLPLPSPTHTPTCIHTQGPAPA